ncbi:helix-hairpin-helix domain-containing protein [bacterium]|nr:helix-hairpin-helix domain-containing protein [bacterium]MBU1600014.1 helix-hairpin-helix domain-containing protein [bacterium]MBU2462287.1 helix-hairpin-helix domain-containing protein [bacterium]
MERFKDFIYSSGQMFVFIILIGGLILGSFILMVKRRHNPVPKIQIVHSQKGSQTQTDPKTSTTSNLPKKKPQTFIININTAEKEDLELLPGVSPKIAERIIEFRKNNGKFKQKEDIMEIKGIGEKRFEKWKDLIIIN